LPKPRRLRRFSISDARFALFNIKRDTAELESAVLPLNYPPDGRAKFGRMDVSEARELKTLKTENARLKMLLSLP
jgi:hypothetical protein